MCRQVITMGLSCYRGEVTAIREQIGGVMADFNRQVREAKEKANQ